MTKMKKTKTSGTVLRPQSPSHAVQSREGRRLRLMVNAMSEDVHRAGTDRIAVRAALDHWTVRFNAESLKIGSRLAGGAAAHAERRLQASLTRVAGKRVKLPPSAGAWNDARTQALASADLVASIPRQYAAYVEWSMLDGTWSRDEARKRLKQARGRAAGIVRAGNAQATAAVTRTRCLEMGIKRAVWIHAGIAEIEPRPTHVKKSGKTFNLVEGWWDPAEGRKIQPSELFGCQCIARPVVPRGVVTGW